MSGNNPLLILELSCDDAINWVINKITQAGLSSMRTFDLRVARREQIPFTCPQHGTELCDCQMVVLLIYENRRQPVTIMAHGYNGQTWFSVVDTPQQHPDPHLEAAIRHLMEKHLYRPNN
jgi:hypothetical protein